MKNSLINHFLIIMLIIPLYSQNQEMPAQEGVTIDINFRALVPGEVIKVIIQENKPLSRVRIEFSGKIHDLRKRVAPDHWMAMIGLDMNMKPGIYFMNFSFLYQTGETEKRKEAVQVVHKEFPVKYLKVDEKFVTPPSEVLERIQVESDLVGSLYKIFSSEWFGEGKFIVPCEGERFPNFGERRFFNGKPRSPHSGVDISAPSGTPVYASNSGKVLLAMDLYFSGNTVIIDHGLGVISMYCHFSKIEVDRGQIVSKGDKIGEVGATGRVTGPHLHWGIKVSNSRVDPFSLVSLDF
jgi:murein DD-endopeptidase MepM/ murein hydrolase activator NlpD